MFIHRSLALGCFWILSLALTSCEKPAVIPKPVPVPVPVFTDPAPVKEVIDFDVSEVASVPLFEAPLTPILPAQRNFIIEQEVGSVSESYYMRHFAHPTVPGVKSGITIGIGYDLGYNSERDILRVWVKSGDRVRLASVAGITRSAARAKLPSVKDILIPYWMAIEVYDTDTIPVYYQRMQRAWPSVDNLNPVAQGALLSIIFNRGWSLVGDSRVDLRTIARLVPKKDYQGIADAIRHMSVTMRTQWAGQGGLFKRREAEAKLVESCIR